MECRRVCHYPLADLLVHLLGLMLRMRIVEPLCLIARSPLRCRGSRAIPCSSRISSALDPGDCLVFPSPSHVIVSSNGAAICRLPATGTFPLAGQIACHLNPASTFAREQGGEEWKTNIGLGWRWWWDGALSLPHDRWQQYARPATPGVYVVQRHKNFSKR